MTPLRLLRRASAAPRTTVAIAALSSLILVACSSKDERDTPVSAATSLSVSSAKHAWSGAGLLDIHNAMRARHGASGLSWSASLAQKAQSWAEGCGFHHSGAPGENLAHTTGPKSPVDLVKLWYDEEKDYDYRSGTAHSAGAVIGHFTQLVWTDTREIGCGVAQCPSLGTYLVCRYDPPGNVISHYQEHVKPPR